MVVVGAFGPSAPTFRVRAMNLAEDLARLGVSMVPRSLFSAEEADAMPQATVSEKWALVRAARRRVLRSLATDAPVCDVALIQRQADLLPTLALERAAANGRRLVYDVDDSIWVDAAAPGRHSLAWLKASRRKARWLAARADHVIAGNRILAEWLSRFTDRLTVVPSLVDHRQIAVRHHQSLETLTLGWIGSRSTAGYLERLRGPLERLATMLQGRTIRLLVVGGQPPRFERVEVEGIAWSPAAEVQALGRMDVGLMPLPDNPWTRGKCAYKALQYMSAGVPVVADDVGVSGEVIGERVGGLIAHADDDWIDALATLASDANLRNTIGAAGRRRVEQEFSVTRWAPTLAQILRGDG